jgi:hypothetical protein
MMRAFSLSFSSEWHFRFPWIVDVGDYMDIIMGNLSIICKYKPGLLRFWLGDGNARDWFPYDIHGSSSVKHSQVVMILILWVLFRVMFGAGMFKIRGDTCWKDLTCMYYHYETQPIPNPLSWYFHNFRTPDAA